MPSDLFNKAFKDVEIKPAICPKCKSPAEMELVTTFTDITVEAVKDRNQYWECTNCWYRIDLVVKGKTV